MDVRAASRDRGTVRMVPGFARAAALAGLNRPGRNVLAEQLLFDAARAIDAMDLFGPFLNEEVYGLDWLDHYLCDSAMSAFIAELQKPAEEEQRPEELFSKRNLATLGSDVMDDV